MTNSRQHSFEKLYTNFTGSGNINGKYWIIGLESGGSLNNDYKGKKLSHYFENSSEDELTDVLSDFNGEGSHSFLPRLLKIIKHFPEKLEIKVDNENNLYYKQNGNVFRTNIFLLPVANTENEKNEFKNYLSEYSKYIYDINVENISEG